MLSCEPSTLRVLVVDDHELTRLTLQLAFASQKNIEVVGLASNGKEAVEMVQNCYPDVKLKIFLLRLKLLLILLLKKNIFRKPKQWAE